MNGWSTGDFYVVTAWSDSQSWGDEVALSVEVGDAILISKVDSQG